MKSTLSIGALAKETGVSTHTLRVWESRHGILQPGRSEKGTRQFTLEDVRRVKAVRKLVRSGHQLSALAGLETDQLEQLVSRSLPEEPQIAGDPAAALKKRFLDAVEIFDRASAEQVLSSAAILLEPIPFLQDVLVSALVELGERWHRGEMRVAHEHFATGIARGLLLSLDGTYPQTRSAKVIVAATLPTESHDVGLLASSLYARMHGWEVVYFGTDMPAEEIVYAAEKTQCRMVMISCVAGNAERTQQGVSYLEKELPPGVKLAVGGRMAPGLRTDRAVVVSSIEALKPLF